MLRAPPLVERGLCNDPLVQGNVGVRQSSFTGFHVRSEVSDPFRHLPRFTTLQKTSRRPLATPRALDLLDATLTLAYEKSSSPGG